LVLFGVISISLSQSSVNFLFLHEFPSFLPIGDKIRRPFTLAYPACQFFAPVHIIPEAAKLRISADF
jgi:hypothetical protein